jgi:hypothetical protein
MKNLWFYVLLFIIVVLISYFIYKYTLRYKEPFQTSTKYLISLSPSVDLFSTYNKLPYSTLEYDRMGGGRLQTQYWGTLSSAQKTAIDNAIIFYNTFGTAALRTGYPYQYQINEFYLKYNSNAYTFSTDRYGLITPAQLRRLPGEMADTIVEYMYNKIKGTIYNIETKIFTLQPASSFTNINDFRADNAKGFFPQAWLDAKRKNDMVQTYALFDATNNDAAYVYLASQPELANYMEQFGFVAETQAINVVAGEAFEKTISIVGTSANVFKSLLMALRNPSSFVTRVRIASRVNLAWKLRKIAFARQALKGVQVGASVAKGLKGALTAAKTALRASPWGAIMTLVEIIVDLIPKDLFQRLGVNAANNKIASQLLRCPIGYIECDNISDEEFSSVMDYMPLPQNIANLTRAMNKKLSCVAYDENGEQDIREKVQCTGWQNPAMGGDTCFVDPPPPVILYPVEPSPPALESVSTIFTNLFPDFQEKLGEPIFVEAAQLNSLGTLTSTDSNVYLNRLRTIWPYTGYDFTFNYGANSNMPAMTSFFTNSDYAGRNMNAYFTLSLAGVSTFSNYLTTELMASIYDNKRAYPECYSADDKAVYNHPTIAVPAIANYNNTLEGLHLRVARYHAKKYYEVQTYPEQVNYYSTQINTINAELVANFGTLNQEIFKANFLNSIAQWAYDTTYTLTQGSNTLWIKKFNAIQLVCENYFITCADMALLNRDGSVKQEGNTSGGYGSGIGFFVTKNAATNSYTPTAFVHEKGNVDSLFNKGLFPYYPIEYNPTITFRYTRYNQPSCFTTNILTDQINLYKQSYPNKNIKSITGFKQYSTSCTMAWIESDYNPNENTESITSNVMASFVYDTPNTPWPYSGFATGNTPILNTLAGFSTTTTSVERNISSFTPPVVQPPRGLPPEQYLLGCDIRCADKRIQKLIIDRYNGLRDPDGGTTSTLTIKKAFTAKPNRCDVLLNVNTGRGVVEEQRRRVILRNAQDANGRFLSCQFVVDSIGAKETGTFVSFTEGFEPVPIHQYKEGFQSAYPGYQLQTTTIPSTSVITTPRYNFGENVMNSLTSFVTNSLNSLTNSGSNARLRTYATLGTNTTLQGCPSMNCTNTSVLSSIAAFYNSENFGQARMLQITKANTAGQSTCDILFMNESSNASRQVNRTPTGARFTLRKNPARCEYEAVAYQLNNAFPSLNEIENLSTPLFTANTAMPQMARPITTSTNMGCVLGLYCTHPNFILQMGNLYTSAEQRSISTIYRVAQTDKVTCQMELWYFYNERDSSKARNRDGSFPQRLVSGIDTYNFTFRRDNNQSSYPTRCFFYLTGGARDATFGFKESGLLNSLNVPKRPIQYNTLRSVAISCPSLRLDCSNSAVQANAAAWYNNTTTASYRDTMSVRSIYNIDNTRCEMSIQRNFPDGSRQFWGDSTQSYGQFFNQQTDNNTWNAFHKEFQFTPDLDCRGFSVVGMTNVNFTSSFTDVGALAPPPSYCFPVNCQSSTIVTALSNYYSNNYRNGVFPITGVVTGIPWKPAATIGIEKSRSITSNTCEYQINFGASDKQQGKSYDSKYHPLITLSPKGANCQSINFTIRDLTMNESKLFTPLNCPSFTGTEDTTLTSVKSYILSNYKSGFYGTFSLGRKFLVFTMERNPWGGSWIYKYIYTDSITDVRIIRGALKPRTAITDPYIVEYEVGLSGPFNVGSGELTQSMSTEWQVYWHPTITFEFLNDNCSSPNPKELRFVSKKTDSILP